VQCGVAVLEKPGSSADPKANVRTVKGRWVWECPDLPKLLELRYRQRDLLAFDWCPVSIPRTTRRINTKTIAIQLLDGNGFRSAFVFRRGFVEEATLPAADWLQHADGILAAHPVTAVRLTTLPEIEVDPVLGTGQQIVASLMHRDSWHTLDGIPEGGLPETLLRLEWPRVTFTLPEGTP
jgi:hypothetical protein